MRDVWYLVLIGCAAYVGLRSLFLFLT